MGASDGYVQFVDAALFGCYYVFASTTRRQAESNLVKLAFTRIQSIDRVVMDPNEPERFAGKKFQP